MLFGFWLQVVRSPDGESRAYAVGQLSIQRAAVWILQRYYTEFSIYNPYLERLPVSKSRKGGGGSSFKFYDVDGMGNNTLQVGKFFLNFYADIRHNIPFAFAA